MPRVFKFHSVTRLWLAGVWLSACSSGGTQPGTGATQTGNTTQAGMPASPAAEGGRSGGTDAAGRRAPTMSSAGSSSTGVAGTKSSGAAGSGTTPAAGAVAAGTGGADAAGSSGAVAAGSGGTSGAAGAAPTGTALKEKCEGGSLDACSSFVTSYGVDIAFGPYGAIMEPNVGAGFENAIASGDADDNATCSGFTALFGADAEQTAKLLDTGSLDFALYTVYRPVNLVEGEKYPIITWGNGTCAAPEGYGALLRYVASYGFFVVAPNSRWVGSGEAQRHGIDFMLAANEDSSSPYYQKLDPERIGAMGHSQGGQGTVAASSDSRIKAAILWNGGSSANGKPFLLVTGDRDIGDPNVASVQSSVQAADKAAYLFYHMIPMEGSAPGHLTLMQQPERVVEPAVAWWKMILNGDAEAKTYFVGADCKLCGKDAEFEFGAKGLE